jgi:hypothetical protein
MAERRKKDIDEEVAHCGYRVRCYLDRRALLLTEREAICAASSILGPAAEIDDRMDLPDPPPEVRIYGSADYANFLSQSPEM